MPFGKNFFNGKRKGKIVSNNDGSTSEGNYLTINTNNLGKSSLVSNNPRTFADPLPNARKQEEVYDIEHIDKFDRNPREEEVSQDYNLIVDGNPVYVVKQKRGFLSIFFSILQIFILGGMMIQCSIAPLQVNPMVGPYPDALSYWGGKNAYDILYGHEYWRLFTPILLHAGIFHLLCNVAVQLDTGAFFEREWGSLIWLIVYLGSAASGSILSVIVSPNTVGVGSSSSVCGLFGAKLAEALCRSRESTKTSQRELSHAILCEQFGTTLCSVILILLFSFIPFVDWAAHIGGLIGGFFISMMIFSCQIKTIRWKVVMFTFAFVFTMIGFSISILHMIEETKEGVAKEMADVCGYYMEIIEDYQCNCMMERHEQE